MARPPDPRILRAMSATGEDLHLSVPLADDVRERMERSRDRLAEAASSGEPVYGLTRGYGPLVEYDADTDEAAQGLGLIAHLSAGQGPSLSYEESRRLVVIRLRGMTRGYSGLDPARWEALAAMVNAGFVPVVPSRGTVSASGDLTPLAHAASALAGEGEAWSEGGLTQVAAVTRLRELGLEPFQWHAREALAFVNGTSVSLAITAMNQDRLSQHAWAAAALTGIIVRTLGATTEPYAETVVTARGGSPGHGLAAAWIRGFAGPERAAGEARQLQEHYSLRCAPQVIGTVLDFSAGAAEILRREIEGTSDNPVVAAEGVFHAGNFHAASQAVASDLHAVLVHQLAYLSDRQLALICDPATNGGLTPLFAARPGATSGLSGVEVAAASFVSEIRQRAAPASTTAIPSNLGNQDVVPMALVAARRVTEQLELNELVLGSLAVGVSQLVHATGTSLDSAPAWLDELVRVSPRLDEDRPLAAEVRQAAAVMLSADQTSSG